MTISTNMAGRGTDIVLGEGVLDRGASTSSAPNATNPGASTTSSAAARGARAIPGTSRFYLSLEDDLLRIFGSERIPGS